MSQSTRAWLLHWPVQPIALALCEVVEIVEAPEIHRVPCGPPWCRALLIWRDRTLPLALPKGERVEQMQIVVVAYQRLSGEPLRHAALAVRGVPRQIEVTAAMDCDLPAGSPLGAAKLRACFQFEQRTIVVPELSSLFEPANVLPSRAA